MADIFHDMVLDRDRFELSLGDTLDVKAGIVLAVITLLGTLTAALLASTSLGKCIQAAQLASLFLLVLGSLFAVWTLVPRGYFLPNLPDEYAKWFQRLEQHYKDNPAEADLQVAKEISNLAMERIKKNHDINRKKSRYLVLSFWPTLLALIVDIVTLITLMISRLSS